MCPTWTARLRSHGCRPTPPPATSPWSS
jgi:hypothetical protein